MNMTIFSQNGKEFLSIEESGWFNVRRIITWKGRHYATTEQGELLEVRKGRNGKISLLSVPAPEAELIPILRRKLLKEREKERQARKGA